MATVGVYKTNVDDRSAAETIVDAICQHLPGCAASFDLEDCDNVLRVESSGNGLNESKVMNLLEDFGYQIERLP